MAGRKTLLTPEVTETICSHIRGGAFDYIAAQAAGIGQSTFYDWLAAAEKPDADPALVEFSAKVAEARADARRDAENRVHKEQPFNWLRYGPGRERPGQPGWTDERTVNVQTGDTPIKLTWAGEDGEADAED